MNVNKICAAVSALCFAGTAVMLSMNKQPNNSASALERLLGDVNGNGVVDAVDASNILSYYSYISTDHEYLTLEQYLDMRNKNETEAVTSPQTTENKPSENIKLKSGGDTFTIAVWNADNAPRYLDTWLSIHKKNEVFDYTEADAKGLKTPSGAKINVINFGVGGREASEHYDSLLLSGNDLDVYYCEADWAVKYIENDTVSAPLSDLGFTDEDFAQTYKFADELGHNSKGVRKAVAPFINPGGFAYRTDLAKDYLNISSPAEMQKAIGSWDDFVSTAKKLAGSSNGNIALADTVGGMFEAYTTSHKFTDADENITPDAKTFADYAKTLWECGGVTKNFQWSDEWTRDGEDGKVMGYFIPTWGMNGFFYTAAENSKGKWELVQGPEPFYWGGMWTLVNPATDNADDCASFIRSSCLDKKNLLITAEDDEYLLPNNKEALKEIAKDPTLSDIGSIDIFGSSNYLSSFEKTAESISATPFTYSHQSDREYYMIYSMIEKYFEGGCTWEETEKACKESRYWNVIK